MESRQKLNKRDITSLAFRSSLLQASFNYERMQAGGWTYSMAPQLEKIYGDDKEGLSLALQDNLQFINTHPNLAGFLMGLLLSMEEQKVERETINGLKSALFAPLAGIGDALFWFTLLPITAGLCASLAQSGSILGPILFFLVFFTVFLARVPFTRLGYALGTSAVSKITAASEKIAKSATILGITVIGGLIASYVHLKVVLQIPVNSETMVNLQTDFFDKIFPNILPMAYTLLMLYLLKKKRMNPTTLILVTFIMAIVLSYFKIL